MGQAPIMGGLCKFKAPNMGVKCTSKLWQWQLTVANWQLTITVTMTRVPKWAHNNWWKDSKKDSKIDLMLKLHCIWYSKEFCENCIYSLPGN